MVRPKYVGTLPSVFVYLFVSKAYFTARREYFNIRKKLKDNNDFKVQCFITFDYVNAKDGDGEVNKAESKTARYTSSNIKTFIEDIISMLGR